MNIIRKTCRNAIRAFKDGNARPLFAMTNHGQNVDGFNFFIKGKPEINSNGQRIGFKQSYWMRKSIATGKSKCPKKYWLGLE